MIIKKQSGVLTDKELEVIEKKLSGKKINQQDSNYLSKYVRPKLKEITLINAKFLLDALEYNQKALSIERKIKQILLEEVKDIDSIIIYGSAIQTNYKKYNDVDVLVIVKKKFWKKLGEKYRRIMEIKKEAKKSLIALDLEVYDKKTFYASYSSNPSLIYQLKDRKVIYGRLKLPKKLTIPKLELRMKLDYSFPEKDLRGYELYKAIRNLVLINLILQKIIDNKELYNSLNKEIGEKIALILKKGKESAIERKIAMLILKKLFLSTLKELKEAKWEKIELSNR